MIKIEWNPNVFNSVVCYYKTGYETGRSPFVSKDGREVARIKIGYGSPGDTEAMSLGHEVGHVLLVRKSNMTSKTGMEDLRCEIEAWRVAKSFMKKKYWREKEAISSIKEYADFYNIKVNWRKFRIIPLNKGVKF